MKQESKAKADYITCLKCTTAKAAISANYYINTNPLFSSDKLNVCKSCINKFIGIKDSEGYVDRVKLVLGLMNKPFIADTWIASSEDWSKYIPQISSLPNFKGKSFSDSSFLISESTKEIFEKNMYSEKQLEINDEDKNQYELFWGKGFENDEYLYLENQYEALLNAYECDSYAQEMLFQEIAHKRLEIQKLREKEKPTDKEIKTLNDLLTSSNIKPVQETGANAAEQATFGTLIKKYENERPIPEPDPMWADVDGIKKYIQVWFLGHLCQMLGIKNSYSEMYEEEKNKYTVDAPLYEEDEEVVGNE
ncbi:hypothetical protein D3C87_645590 [compost metagenome]